MKIVVCDHLSSAEISISERKSSVRDTFSLNDWDCRIFDRPYYFRAYLGNTLYVCMCLYAFVCVYVCLCTYLFCKVPEFSV